MKAPEDVPQQPSDDVAQQPTLTDELVAVEHRALRLSMAMSVLLSGASVVLGIITRSQVILFDGMYGALGIGLTWLSIVASRLVASEPTPKYPFGREALAPMVVALQGVALLAACLYALIDALLVISHGGDEVAAGVALAFGIVSTLGTFSVWLLLRGPGRRSALVKADATQWLASSALSGAVVVAFALVLFMRHQGWHDAARYVDPAMVILCCAALAPVPMRMIRTTMVELLEGAPDPEVQRPVRVAVHKVAEQMGLPEPYLRMTKTGPKLYVEAEFVVTEGVWRIEHEDEVRRRVLAHLTNDPHTIWLSVEFSHDPELVL